MDSATPEKRFAVLSDADNVSAKAIAGLNAQIANYGVAIVKRIYGARTLPNLASRRALRGRAACTSP